MIVLSTELESHGDTASQWLEQSNREQIGPTLHRAETSPNYQLTSTIVRTAVRSIERADCLFEVRRTARPHEITFNLTRD
jgi:hypothetical protein